MRDLRQRESPRSRAAARPPARPSESFRRLTLRSRLPAAPRPRTQVSIWGRRAFERHFGEPQHQHGMRCLGIPSLKIFHGITQIADAQALWQAHQASTTDAAKALDEEEFEDGDGNVYNKKTYEDLRRQGLI